MSTTRRGGLLAAAILLLVSGFVVLSGSVARAADISFTDTIPVQNTNWPSPTSGPTTLTFPQFDPALGTLQSVTVAITGELAGSSQVENLDPNGPTTSTLDLGAAISVDGDPGGGTITVGTNPISSNTVTLDPFDGAVDFAGPSGASFLNLSSTETSSQTITDAGVLVAYTGSGNVTLDAAATANSFAIGGGNVAALFDTDAGASVTVTYTFQAAAAPGIEVQKTPDTQTVTSGSDVTFSITVTNTGNVALSNVAVSDPLAPGCDSTVGDLAVGASSSYDCTVANVTAGFTNVATVTGEGPGGEQVSDEDDAVVEVTAGPAPGIDIEKATNGQDAVAAPGPSIRGGSAVDWTYVVTNTGNVALTNVAVADDQGVTVTCPQAALAVGESMTCTASGTATAGQYTNVGTATADSPGGPVTASDPSNYLGEPPAAPAIAIQKTPDTQTVTSGSTVTFSITVTITGNVALINVAVTDPLAPGCDAAIGDLAVGASTSYDCTVSNVTAGFTNVATVTGEGPGGQPVTDDDDAVVEVTAAPAPGVEIQKTPDSQTATPGATVTFSITVTNTGNVALTDVAVSDPLAPGCNRTIGDLAVGASTSYDCTVATVTAAFTNVATVTGEAPDGSDVSDQDDARVDIVAIDVVKVASAASASAGDTVTYTYTVTNTGTVTLTNVTLTDDKLGAISLAKTTLAPGESTTGTATATVATGDLPGPLVNVATVTGVGPGGKQVTDQDDATVPLAAVLPATQPKTLPATGLDTGQAAGLGLMLLSLGLLALAGAFYGGAGRVRFVPQEVGGQLRAQLLPMSHAERVAARRRDLATRWWQRRLRKQFRRLG